MKKIYSLTDLKNLNISITKPCIIFLYGDLGAGKTTLSQAIIKKYSHTSENISSPTYTYYNTYQDNQDQAIIHFDLYRLTNYDQFVSIGGEEILDNNEGIILIEWPQILELYYTPDIKISLNKTERDDERGIDIEYK